VGRLQATPVYTMLIKKKRVYGGVLFQAAMIFVLAKSTFYVFYGVVF